MSAADAREELEAAIWHAVAIDPNRRTVPECKARVDAALTAADAYAELVARDFHDRIVAGLIAERERQAAASRERLEQATAERAGRTA